jgi:hypothetical protein
MPAVLPYAPHIQLARKKGTKRPQKEIPCGQSLILGTKIPQGVILPADMDMYYHFTQMIR